MSECWQVKLNDKALGPFSWDQILKLASSGRLTRETPLRKGENSIWLLAGTLPELFPESPKRSTVQSGPVFASDVNAIPELNFPTSSDTSNPDPIPTAPALAVLAGSGSALPYARKFQGWLSHQPTSFWDLLDWRFEVYLTPWILRMGWALMLIFSLLSLALVATNAVYAVAFDRSLWSDLNEFRNQSGQGAAERIQPRAEFQFQPERLGENRSSAILGACASLFATSLSLLLCRVFCEFLIVQFHIATSLKQLVQHSRHDPTEPR